jgi:hypothetical protein
LHFLLLSHFFFSFFFFCCGTAFFAMGANGSADGVRWMRQNYVIGQQKSNQEDKMVQER